MHLAETTWTEADAEADVALLPVGSTEQHGPHAPLGTDTLAAEAVAARGAEAYDGEAVVAPAVPVGVSEEHRHFAGTLWVSPDTFRAYVRETVESLAHHGWNRVVVINGHGGNVDALRELSARLTRDGVAYTVPFTWFDGVETDLEMGHAGPMETSLLLATRPELVREGRLDEAATDGAARWGEWAAGVNLAYDSAEFASNGVVGDPREASEQQGEDLLEAAGEGLAALLGVVADREWDREKE
jgi:creatinine amidohydrolase